jgi:hypothetical protein
MTMSKLIQALRNGAGTPQSGAGAAVELLVWQESWLGRNDFLKHVWTDTVDGEEYARVNWAGVVKMLDERTMRHPPSGSEERVLRIAASLAGGVPVDLREAVRGLGWAHFKQVVLAVVRASGREPGEGAYGVSWS